MEDVAFQSGGGSGGIVVINRSKKKNKIKKRRPNSPGFGKVNRLQHAERESTDSLFIRTCAGCCAFAQLTHAVDFAFFRVMCCVLHVYVACVASEVMACVSTLLPPDRGKLARLQFGSFQLPSPLLRRLGSCLHPAWRDYGQVQHLKQMKYRNRSKQKKLPPDPSKRWIPPGVSVSIVII